MSQLEVRKASRIFRGTWDEVLTHSEDIPKTSEVEVRVFESNLIQESDPTILLLASWIASAPTTPEAIREAEEDLLEFKRSMNLPRKETGARLHYPEAE
ncbi:MAG: hypothetical protein NT023_09020 [Armatimonadetes bacterium]|nr:hypothetical protein [Armatimonadota bacterium]